MWRVVKWEESEDMSLNLREFLLEIQEKLPLQLKYLKTTKMMSAKLQKSRQFFGFRA